MEAKHYLTSRECITALFTWATGGLFLFFTDVDKFYLSLWLLVIPLSIGLYWYSFKNLIPHIRVNQQNFRSYISKVVALVLISILPLCMIISISNGFPLLVTHANNTFIGSWLILVPSIICLYWYSFHHLIPVVKEIRDINKAYVQNAISIIFISLLPLSILLLVYGSDRDEFPLIIMIHILFQLLIVLPLTWHRYAKLFVTDDEVLRLKTALIQSNANFALLQSQINPHFLFNALNTIFGTALQEKAPRTSEAVQKLGDMMRFMLHENLKEKISLKRETEYLRNFILIQKLRTELSDEIRIVSEIEDGVEELEITPMLLIPFVENAFKHGISLQEPSYVKIKLGMTGTHLYFEICNSIHIRDYIDPESEHSGIGLNNVEQRLFLLYPDKHSLIIEKSKKEFFVKLKLELNSSNPDIN